MVFLEKSRCTYCLRNLLITSKTWASLVAQLFKESACSAGNAGSSPGSGRFPWRRQPTPVFLPRKSHGQRSLAGYQSMGSQRVGHDQVTNTFTFKTFLIIIFFLLPLSDPSLSENLTYARVLFHIQKYYSTWRGPTLFLQI